MSDSSGESIQKWVRALDELLLRLWGLEQRARNRGESCAPQVMNRYGPVVGLNLLFARYNCPEYRVAEVRDRPNEFTVFAPDLPPETELAALRAVLAWLQPAPYYPPFITPEELRALQELRRRLDRTAQDRLDAIAAANAGRSTVPWEGHDDWEALKPLVRRLLQYMNERPRADLADICPKVWGKDAADVSPSALHSAIHKANVFLSKRERRTLEKVRGEPSLRWT
jgi:hypothetical protein